jgi:putative sugar O-methyltransferase
MNPPSRPPLSAAIRDELPGVEDMFAELAEGPQLHRPSAYWEHINACNLQQLERDGFARFKRSVNQNYFGFVPTGRGSDQYEAVVRSWKRRPNPAVLLPRRIDSSGLTGMFSSGNPLAGWRLRLGHARYLALLWEFARLGDRRGLLDTLEEPELGAPVTIGYRRRRISQDLCNSVCEFYAATETPDGRLPRSAIEIGSGYGRVAWVFLRAVPGIRYLICDIPPALAVAQRYLTTLFPDRPAFRYRRFAHYDEIAEEFEAARIAFVSPDQLDRLPPQRADLVMNISSLHEMRRDQIAFYLGLVGRHCGGHFYTKQWWESVNSHDDLVLRPADYPIPDTWQQVYLRSHPVQTMFFEALYRVR